ncbi:hypothetical protein [Agrobacterium tumefaciens]|uniref:hypothetical protein n=1 Tax=Agrobacterium tumefaciens TaxID=358 RepID=UPI002FDBCBCC
MSGISGLFRRCAIASQDTCDMRRAAIALENAGEKSREIVEGEIVQLAVFFCHHLASRKVTATGAGLVCV